MANQPITPITSSCKGVSAEGSTVTHPESTDAFALIHHDVRVGNSERDEVAQRLANIARPVA